MHHHHTTLTRNYPRFPSGLSSLSSPHLLPSNKKDLLATHRWLFRTHLHHSDKKLPHTSEGLFLFPSRAFRRAFSLSARLTRAVETVFFPLSRAFSHYPAFFFFPFALLNLLILPKLSILLTLPFPPHTTCVSPSHITHIAHICTHPVCACFCVFVRLTRAMRKTTRAVEAVVFPLSRAPFETLSRATQRFFLSLCPP